MKDKTKKYSFQNEDERELAVCIAVQKLGRASVSEIIDKIQDWGSKITEKQVRNCAEKLRAKQLLSIDLSEQDEKGLSIQRYLMKNIKLTIPEVGQIKDIIDNPDLKVLKDELDKAKRMRKRGLKTFDYYTVKATFQVIGNIQGFIPDERKISRHYREGENIVFYPYHFKNWFRANLPLVNRSSSSVSDLRFAKGIVEFNGSNELPIIDKFVTNIEGLFDSPKGTAGRGTRQIECLPEGCFVHTEFAIPREYIRPEKISEAISIICKHGGAFGGGAKLSTGRLVPVKVEIAENMIWKED